MTETAAIVVVVLMSAAGTVALMYGVVWLADIVFGQRPR
jgi:hypothetical protein